MDYALDLIANGEKLLEETGDAFNLPLDAHHHAKVQIPPFLNDVHNGFTTDYLEIIIIRKNKTKTLIEVCIIIFNRILPCFSYV